MRTCRIRHQHKLRAAGFVTCKADQSNSFCRVKTSVNRRVFEFKAAATASYITAGIHGHLDDGQGPTAGYHNIVQDLAWPSPKDEIPLQGLAPVEAQPERPWFQENLLAHTLQYRQMLQPAVKASDLQVLVCEQCMPATHLCITTWLVSARLNAALLARQPKCLSHCLLVPGLVLKLLNVQCTGFCTGAS